MSLATPSSAFNEIESSKSDSGTQDSPFGNFLSIQENDSKSESKSPSDSVTHTDNSPLDNFDFSMFKIPNGIESASDNKGDKLEANDNTDEKDEPMDTEKFKNKVFEGWSEAKDNDKYFLFMADSEYCGFCDRTEKNMKDPSLAKYSDKFVTSITDPDVDTDAQYFVDRFDVKKYPTILLMKPVMGEDGKVQKVDLIGRMTGEQSAKEMDEYFKTALAKYEKQKEEDLLRTMVS